MSKSTGAMIGCIVESAFTAYDEAHFPECDNDKYLKYKRVSTGLSSEIVGYGYKRKVREGLNWSEWKWITLKEAGQ